MRLLSILTDLSILHTVIAMATADSPPTRGHKKKERTRRQLLDAAVDVIAERGEGFSVSDVTARAQVANGTFYNYFTDRDELVDAVAVEVLATFADEAAVIVATEDPAARFATITALALTHVAENPDQARVLLRLDAVQAAMATGDPFRHLQADLAAGYAAGRFTVGSADAAVDVVLGSLLSAARRIVDTGAGPDHRRAVLEHLLASLGLSGSEPTDLAEQAMARAQTINATTSTLDEETI